ncbi:hypothetical protein BU17DRAFT_47819 [Hysterangium stoloniferum]|nr:hypothetical protein BU17DRAFT_47819 [Hysterangium stoloniferum]
MHLSSRLLTFAILVVVTRSTGAIYARAVDPAGPNCSRNYTVQSGDICNSISAAQNVSTQLAQVNTGVIDANCANLFAGEHLCLGAVGHDCTTVAVVQPGDTCIAISVSAGIALSLLLQNNPNVDSNCDNLLVGEARFLDSHYFDD